MTTRTTGERTRRVDGRRRDRRCRHRGVPRRGGTDRPALPHGRRRSDPRAARVSRSGLASALPLAVVLPILGAIVCPLLGRRWRRASLIAGVASLAGSAVVLS